MTNQEQYKLICEKSKKYDRLVGVLDKIRAEIVELCKTQNVGVLECLDIIDKYKAESELKEE